MKNYLPHIHDYSRQVAARTYRKLLNLTQGISLDGFSAGELNLAQLRLELAQWQKRDDGDALTQTSINYITWMPVVYDDVDENGLHVHQAQGGAGYIVTGSEHVPGSFMINYNYGGQTEQNVVEINAGGCLTRINLNPAITINGTAYAHYQEVPSSTWTVIHNLGYHPNVILKDLNGVEFEGLVTNTSMNQLTILFSEPVSGYAHLS